jgi:hypothetical protein
MITYQGLTELVRRAQTTDRALRRAPRPILMTEVCMPRRWTPCYNELGGQHAFEASRPSDGETA